MTQRKLQVGDVVSCGPVTIFVVLSLKHRGLGLYMCEPFGSVFVTELLSFKTFPSERVIASLRLAPKES